MIRLENEIRKKVFCLILQGYSLVEIAEKLGVSKRTGERFSSPKLNDRVSNPGETRERRSPGGGFGKKKY